MVARSHTFVLELNGLWEGTFESEPYETAWAREAIVFIRALAAEKLPATASARVQISPDGLHWCDEGTTVALRPVPEVTFCRLTHFGGWLRLAGSLPPGASVKVIAYVALKE